MSTSGLKQARLACTLSQTELGTLVGVGQSTVSKLERGERQLTAKWAIKFSGHLKTDPLNLLKGEIDRQSRLHMNADGKEAYNDIASGI